MTKHVSKSQKQGKNKVFLNSLSSRFISNQKHLEVSTKLTQLSKLLNSGFSCVLVSSVFIYFFFCSCSSGQKFGSSPGSKRCENFSHMNVQTCHLFVKACVRNLTPFQANDTIYIFRSKLADINICPETSTPAPFPRPSPTLQVGCFP